MKFQGSLGAVGPVKSRRDAGGWFQRDVVVRYCEGRVVGVGFERVIEACRGYRVVSFFGPLQAENWLLGPFLGVSGAEASLDRRRIKFCVY